MIKPKFIILGIVLCVLSSAPLMAQPDGFDSATISGAYELSRKPVLEPGLLTLLTVGVLTLIAREKLKLDRKYKNKRNARMEAYWQALKKKQHKSRYRPLVEIPPVLLPQDTKQRPPAKDSQPEEAGFLQKRAKS